MQKVQLVAKLQKQKQKQVVEKPRKLIAALPKRKLVAEKRSKQIILCKEYKRGIRYRMPFLFCNSCILQRQWLHFSH